MVSTGLTSPMWHPDMGFGVGSPDAINLPPGHPEKVPAQCTLTRDEQLWQLELAEVTEQVEQIEQPERDTAPDFE